jgi:ABC-type multidrug transport system fused ATPase/permease subunit
MLSRTKQIVAKMSLSFESLGPVFSRDNLPAISVSTVVTGVSISLNFLAPYVFSKAVVAFTSHENETLAGMEFSGVALAGIYGGLWTLSNILNNARSLSLSSMAPRTAKKMSMELMDHLMDKQSLNYHITTPPGSQLGLIVKCYMSSNNLTSGFIGTIIPSALEISVALGIMSKFYSKEVSLSLLGMVIIYSGYSLLTRKQITELREIMAKKGQACWETYQKMLSNFQVIQQFGNWKISRETLQQVINESTEADIKGTEIIFKTGIGQSVITGLGFTSIGLLVGSGITNGKFNVSDYVTIISYLAQFSNSLNIFGQTLNQFFASLTEIRLVIDELKKKSDITDSFADVPLNIEKANAKIEFKNVSFSYGKDESGNPIKILDNVSFVINPGEKVGIVATSGTGKTTIANLLFRFFDITAGEILINDQNIQSISLDSLRQAIGIVPQNPTLFNDTLYKNIEFGAAKNSEKPTADDINRVITSVCMTEVVNNLKNGVNTLIGERGAKLSGGQQQRIAIARCLMKNPKIFVFDEATSALDAAVEHDIQKNLDQISRGSTTIVFTHKLASLINADRIIVLDQAHLQEQGSHAELIKLNGLYSELWEKQMLGTAKSEVKTENSTPTPTSFISKVNFIQENSRSNNLSAFSLFRYTDANEEIVDLEKGNGNGLTR